MCPVLQLQGVSLLKEFGSRKMRAHLAPPTLICSSMKMLSVAPQLM
jgi:hypothetical protein